MANDNFQTSLDGIVTQKTSVVDVCKSYNEQSSPVTISDQQLREHPFFQTHLPKELGAVLEHWFSDGTLDDRQKDVFHECSAFLLKSSKASPNIDRWLKEQKELIDLADKCVNEIASYGYYIGIGGNEDPSLQSFDWLLQALERAQCAQLLDTLKKCVTSRYYVDALYRLSVVNASVLTITQYFLLVTCPNYILECDRDKRHCAQIVKQMLPTYDEIFAHFLPHIKQWTLPVLLSLVYPIKFILSSTQYLQLEEKKLIYQIASTILLDKSTTDLGSEQGRHALIHTSLSLLVELLRSDGNLLKHCKSQIKEQPDLLDTFKQFAQNDENGTIQLKALELVGLLVPEKSFFKAGNTEKVTGLYIKNLSAALQYGKPHKADEVLAGLRELVQNDEMKQEVMKQNGLPSIIKYAKETTDDPLPLEITYAMTFNSDAKKAINQDTEFLQHVKQLRDSNHTKVSQMAHGIMWKLEGEEKFQKREEEKDKQKDSSKEKADEGKESYDMMISYCWAQQPLCHKINDRLEKDGFKVWLDRDEMHGSIIERMAEAIEQSRFVLICMSSNYKKSTNCKAEAEYAFNRKSKIVPLLVEPGYQADGWLGFLAGSKIYVDFADKEDEEFEKAYDLLIAELERNGLKDAVDQKKTEDKTAPIKEPDTKSEGSETSAVDTREYLSAGSPLMWDEKHVKEFLSDHDLEQLIPVCESMDGPALLEFHHSCLTAPEHMYGWVNNPKTEHHVPLGKYFKFISRLKTFLPPSPPRQVDFRYNFIYPPPTTNSK